MIKKNVALCLRFFLGLSVVAAPVLALFWLAARSHIFQSKSAALVERLSDEDVQSRIATIRQLYDLRRRAQDAVPALVKCLQDDDVDVRTASAPALGAICAKDAPRESETVYL